MVAASPDSGINNEREYAILKRRIQAAGLLDKNPGYYALSITTNLVVWFFCLVLVFTLGSVWAQALSAVGLGIASVQLGFQLHDSGHRQMFVSPGKNALVGLFTANLRLGVSYGWWVQKHNRHHGNPDDVDLDPDSKVGAIAYNDEKARLDNYAIEMQNDPTATAYVIVHPGRSDRPKDVQKQTARVVDYLVNSRGLSRERIVTVVGPPQDALQVELWLYPQGAKLPAP